MLYLGQEVCLENASELIKEVMGVEVSDTTIHREIETYGKLAEMWIEQSNENAEETPMEDHEVMYCEADGSMILTREEGWKEVKLGRIFRSDSILDKRSEGNKIKESSYVAHLGHFTDFCDQMDNSLKEAKQLGPRLVFVCDGALWIKNWMQETYPEATQILDYFHAVEHLGMLAEYIVSEPKKEWTRRYATKLLEEGIGPTIQSLKRIPIQPLEGKRCKEKLLNYFEANAYRMDYPTYDQKGYYIGSGAIESAHRTVIQKRLKLSGQRWTMNGAQRVLNLRVLKMSGKWNVVQNAIRIAA